MLANWTDDQIKRYSRHIVLKEVGGQGQRKLLDSSALVVGAGGLGSPVSLYLAAAGVGRIGIVDFDRVDLSNLQRQILHDTGDVGRLPKDVPDGLLVGARLVRLVDVVDETEDDDVIGVQAVDADTVVGRP